MTTAQLRKAADNAARAGRWAESADLLEQAISQWPASLKGSALSIRVIEGMATLVEAYRRHANHHLNPTWVPRDERH